MQLHTPSSNIYGSVWQANRVGRFVENWNFERYVDIANKKWIP